MKTIRKHFETITAMAEYDRKNLTEGCCFGRAELAIRNQFVSGDDSYVHEAEALLDKINDALPETLRNEWHSDVFGPIISIPDYLSSCPAPFRRERVAESSCAPVKILCSLTSSGGLSADVLRKRGVAILALLMKVQQVRPVDLTLYTELDFNMYEGMALVSLDIESRPLSIGHALNALGNADVARKLFYSAIKAEAFANGGNCQGGWPEGFIFGRGNEVYFKQVKEQFNMTEGDLFIPPTYITDTIINDPLTWINENLQKLVHFEEV